MVQLDLFTTRPSATVLPSPRQLGAVGEARAIAAAPDEWREAALAALEHCCRRWPLFIVDSVWEELGERSDHPDKRAMAGVLTEGERRGWCRRTRETRRSDQRQCHGNLRSVWESCIYDDN